MNAFLSLMFAPTKLAPLSVRIILTFPLQLMSLLNASMKLSVLMLFVVSICTALLDIHVKIAALFATIFNHKWSKHVDTTVGIRWFLGKSL